MKDTSRMTYERITPEKAKVYLEKNVPNNRPINEMRVRNYVHDMLTGAWSDNGETIKFNTQGELIDGQHRLTAIVKAGVSIWTWVARDVDKNAFWTVDTGAIRTGAQIMKMGSAEDDLKKHASLTPIMRMCFRAYGSTHNPTMSMLYEAIESNRTTLEWYYATSPWKSSKLPIFYPTAALAMHLHGVSDADIYEFISAAINNDFGTLKATKAYRHAVQAEELRRRTMRGANYETFMRYAYSFVNELSKITSTLKVYDCTMDSKYKLIKA